jgi:HNH endonuclease
MRIALRTGGGRGVYELAGHQGDLTASSLFGHEISYELTPDLIIPGRCMAALRQGKPRIALDEGTKSRTTHLYRLLSAVLLLPKPKREFKTTHGDELLRFESYSMTAIKVDVAGIDGKNVVLRPTDLLLENADDRQSEVEFTGRMARMIRLWDVAANLDTPLADLVRRLADSVKESDPDYKKIEHCAKEIFAALQTDGDALPLAEKQLGTSELEQAPVALSKQFAHKPEFGLKDDISPHEALIQRVKVWRQQVQRGSAGRKFSKDVSDAYQYRCLFSGQRLPRLEITDSPGVDSAHILPWSTHDLNSVRNGICLNKQCHWAFDQGILRLDFDASSNTYLVSVPARVKQAASRVSFDIAHFESMAGPIPKGRLPKASSIWPSLMYIDELNRYMTSF